MALVYHFIFYHFIIKDRGLSSISGHSLEKGLGFLILVSFHIIFFKFSLVLVSFVIFPLVFPPSFTTTIQVI